MADHAVTQQEHNFLEYWKARAHTLDVRGYSLNHSLLLACSKYLFTVPWNVSGKSPCTQPGLTGRVPSSLWEGLARWLRELRDSASCCSGDKWTCCVLEPRNLPWHMWCDSFPVVVQSLREEIYRRGQDCRRCTRHAADRQSEMM